MKRLLITISLIVSFPLLASDSGVKGKVFSLPACSDPVMVWVSLDKDNYKERLLLLHSTVPVGGSFQFFLKPGAYQLRASDEKGCEFVQRIQVKDKVLTQDVKMVKK
jgi:hypothetical protein